MPGVPVPPGHHKRPHGQECQPVRNASVPACHNDCHDDARDADRGNEHGDPEGHAVHVRSLAQPFVRRAHSSACECALDSGMSGQSGERAEAFRPRFHIPSVVIIENPQTMAKTRRIHQYSATTIRTMKIAVEMTASMGVNA